MYASGVVSLDGFAPVLGQFDRATRWNGWLCPFLDPHAVVTVLNAINADNGVPIYHYDWTEEELLMLITIDDADDESGIELVCPDGDGLYPLGFKAWIWTEELDQL